jgi:hypothetical protein
MPVETRARSIYGAGSGGFALLSVLLVTGLVSALVTASAMTSRADRANAALERRIVQATALADAGLNRAIASLEIPGDPFLLRLQSDRKPVRWRFSGEDILLSLVPEAGKVDLNAGDPGLVVNVLRAVLHDDVAADRLVRRLAAWRSAGRDLETVRGLLDPADRTSPRARDLETVFTVWTGLRGIDPKVSPPSVLRHLPGLQQGEAEILERARASGSYADLSPFIARFGALLGAARPIYRARAEVTFQGVTVRREALVTHNPSFNRVWVVFWRDVVE